MNLTYARFMSICLSCLSKLLTDRKWQTALLRPGWPGLANRPVRAVWPFGPALAYSRVRNKHTGTLINF